MRDGFCANGIGVGDICTTAMTGGGMVSLFGLSTGGRANDDEKFYLGFTCK